METYINYAQIRSDPQSNKIEPTQDYELNLKKNTV